MTVNKQFITSFLFGGVVFFLTRQFPFANFSVLGNLFVFSLFLFAYPLKEQLQIKEKYSVALIMLWLVGLLIYAVIVMGNPIGLALRFFTILVLLLLAHWVKIPYLQMIKILFVLVVLQALTLIVLEIIMNVMFTPSNYVPFRLFFLKQGWGDIYTHNGFFYKIQLKGNALLPFVFCLTFLKEVAFRYKRIIQIILLLGCVLSGNFAFLIAVFVFILFWYLFNDLRLRRVFNKTLIVGVLGVLGSGFVFSYASDVIQKKSEGRSLPIRTDQAIVLMNNVEESSFSFVIGKGLGNTVDVQTKYKDYKDNIYFELQTIYF